MKTKVNVVYFIIVCMILIWSFPAICQSNIVKNESLFESIIDDYIATCEYKASMNNSKSANIRQAAALSYLKAAYFRNFKGELIKEMINKNINIKPYKIHYYLNKKFFDIVRPKKCRARKSNIRL